MSKMRRKRTVAMLTLCATMLSGAAVTCAGIVDSYSRSYSTVGRTRLSVYAEYESKWGDDRVYYNVRLLGGTEDDKLDSVTNNDVYVCYPGDKEGDEHRTYIRKNLNPALVAGYGESRESRYPDGTDITIRSIIDGYKKTQYCYAEKK